MIGIDLGTKLVKVTISQIRKDHNPIEDVDVPLDPAALSGTVDEDPGYCKQTPTKLAQKGNMW